MRNGIREDRDEEEDEYQRRNKNLNSGRNTVENSLVKGLTDQMGLQVLKRGLIEHKANIKPEVYFVG